MSTRNRHRKTAGPPAAQVSAPELDHQLDPPPHDHLDGHGPFEPLRLVVLQFLDLAFRGPGSTPRATVRAYQPRMRVADRRGWSPAAWSARTTSSGTFGRRFSRHAWTTNSRPARDHQRHRLVAQGQRLRRRGPQPLARPVLAFARALGLHLDRVGHGPARGVASRTDGVRVCSSAVFSLSSAVDPPGPAVYLTRRSMNRSPTVSGPSCTPRAGLRQRSSCPAQSAPLDPEATSAPLRGFGFPAQLGCRAAGRTRPQDAPPPRRTSSCAGPGASMRLIRPMVPSPRVWLRG